jgi:hypothetical protein
MIDSVQSELETHVAYMGLLRIRLPLGSSWLLRLPVHSKHSIGWVSDRKI